MTKERAEGFTMPWGKYKGMTLGYLAREHRDYLLWLHGNCELRGSLAAAVGHLIGEGTPR